MKKIIICMVLLISGLTYYLNQDKAVESVIREKVDNVELNEKAISSIKNVSPILKKLTHSKEEVELTKEEIANVNNDNPVDLEKRDETGNTILMQVLDSDDYEQALELLKKGANPNVKNKEGLTATALAAMTGDFEIYKEFVKLTGEVNPELHAGKTALSVASMEGNLEMVKFILDNEKVQINHQDKMGQSPLFLAVLGENNDVAKLLMKKGADPNLYNNEGIAPIDLALESDQKELVQILKTK